MGPVSWRRSGRCACIDQNTGGRDRLTHRCIGRQENERKKTLKESPVLHAERPQESTVHNEGSLTHARCRPACRALERRRRCGHQGRIFHISHTLDSQTFANNCFGKTSKKTYTMTFLCLQLNTELRQAKRGSTPAATVAKVRGFILHMCYSTYLCKINPRPLATVAAGYFLFSLDEAVELVDSWCAR